MSVMELGETNDARALVPGDARALWKVSSQCAMYAHDLEQAGKGLQRIRTDGWTGKAAEAFWDRYEGEPKQWLVAADSFASAARATSAYADSVAWAQGQAAHAIDLWNSGVAATDRAFRDWQQLRRTSPRMGFDDPGLTLRAEARAVLIEARRQLVDAGDTAARVLSIATEPAPQLRGFADDVSDEAADVGAAIADGAGYVVNGLASFGNAILNHPEGLAAMLAGIEAATAGVGGEVGGVALDATAVGAVAGVPINVASAGLIVTGVGTALAGAGLLMNAASGDDAVHPLRTDNPGSAANQYAPKDGFRGRTEFEQDEIEQFINGHTGDGDIASPRPPMKEVNEALTKGTVKQSTDHDAEEFVYGKIRVIVNYERPWLSTAYEIGS